MDGALWATTSVEPEAGQFTVWIEVVFPDGVVRKRISTYRTESLAEIAALLISRCANVDTYGG